ncbi:4Fe-4S cluster-binding domain-containing protein [Methanosalsum natronophilum]|uniref:4Fe-4S cluster-binding domain-containing protein n=1 Tax=Methanosalsum natronophilum TaxID=768733 RepID=UPI00216A12FE|nr:4Fe-4S cluster-binding domain-containing protein [Methanosalsum natronophilum]MCS3923269.1 putative pyruvate formate lyase activating enzyme [Methanosalsum natronophilum]
MCIKLNKAIESMSSPKFLSTYREIAYNKQTAAFKVAQSIPLKFDHKMSINSLWEIHDKGIEEYKKIIKDSAARMGYITKNGVSNSLLKLKLLISQKLLQNCCFCERKCGVDRTSNEVGYCGVGEISKYATEFIHMGEEPELVPSHTVFFTGCTFSCIYCQNCSISTSPQSGIEIDSYNLAKIVEDRRKKESLNINFVTPIPHLHTILDIVNNIDTNMPIIWNSNMYHSIETSKLLEGVVDLYLGDFKYGNDECAKKLSNANEYMNTVTRNFHKAYSTSEILIRHLLLPNHIECCTYPLVVWIAENIPKIRFNLMFQYYPHYKAYEDPKIYRCLTKEEMQKASLFVKEKETLDIV